MPSPTSRRSCEVEQTSPWLKWVGNVYPFRPTFFWAPPRFALAYGQAGLPGGSAASPPCMRSGLRLDFPRSIAPNRGPRHLAGRKTGPVKLFSSACFALDGNLRLCFPLPFVNCVQITVRGMEKMGSDPIFHAEKVGRGPGCRAILQAGKTRVMSGTD